jgi:hypothetical protein
MRLMLETQVLETATTRPARTRIAVMAVMTTRRAVRVTMVVMALVTKRAMLLACLWSMRTTKKRRDMRRRDFTCWVNEKASTCVYCSEADNKSGDDGTGFLGHRRHYITRLSIRTRSP